MKNTVSILTNFSDKQFDPLDEQTERSYAIAAANGCLISRNELITHNMRLVNSIAKKYRNAGVPFEDIIQAGNLGLILSLNTYDYTKARFSTHATNRIMAQILELFDNVGKVIDVPLQQARAIKKIVEREKALEQELGRSPTYQEMLTDKVVIARAKKVKKSPALLLRVRYNEEISLDLESQDTDNSPLDISNLVADNSPEPLDEMSKTDFINHILKDLTDRQRTIIRLYYGLDGIPMTLKEISLDIGVGPQRVQQIHQEILSKLSSKWGNNPDFIDLLD